MLAVLRLEALLAAGLAAVPVVAAPQPITDEIERSEYEVRDRPHSVIPGHIGGLQVANRAQNLRAYFGDRQIYLVPRTELRPAWALRLARRNVESVAPEAHGSTVSYGRNGLIERYEKTFLEALAAIDRSGADAREKLRLYARIYADVLRANRMCLCGMLAAEYATLPKPMKEEMRHFFDENERWLVAVLEQGRASGTLRFTGPALDAARAIVGSLEGALMLARSYADVSRFETAADRLLAEL